MTKTQVLILELMNRRRLARRNFITQYLGGNDDNKRLVVTTLASTEYLTTYKPDGDGTLERTFPRNFFYIYAKGLRADRALKAAAIEPIHHPDPGEQFWHQMLIDDILLSIEIACKELGLTFTDQYEILGDRPLELPCHITHYFPHTEKTHTSDKALAPDALFAINGTYFALEADRCTEPIERSNLNQTSYLRKFLQYRDVLQNKTYKTEWGIPNLMVLHISTKPERTKSLMTFMETMGGKSQSQCFKSAAALSSTKIAPQPLRTLVTEPYQRVGFNPYTIGEVNERTREANRPVHPTGESEYADSED